MLSPFAGGAAAAAVGTVGKVGFETGGGGGGAAIRGAAIFGALTTTTGLDSVACVRHACSAELSTDVTRCLTERWRIADEPGRRQARVMFCTLACRAAAEA
ncbi:hypothetical protein MTO96_043110 [Rhipicephalus appendiculatus]